MKCNWKCIRRFNMGDHEQTGFENERDSGSEVVPFE